MAQTIQLEKKEYDDMLDYMERLKETVDVLSSRQTVKKALEAMKRIESGEFLTRKDIIL